MGSRDAGRRVHGAHRDRAPRGARARALWAAAVAIEDRLAYNEPADWFYPTRHHLGAALLDADRPREAAAVYRADLQRHPANGWSLFGLSRALRDVGRRQEARVTERAFRRAWANADVVLARSAY